MTIQLIKYQSNVWHIEINGQPFTFSKMLQLYVDSLHPIPANADYGLRWRIGRKWGCYGPYLRKWCMGLPSEGYGWQKDGLWK